jgi:PST family polysaccharide transporter
VHYAGFQLLGQAARSLDSVLVGYFTGAASLGLYANAAKWAKTPLQNIFPPLAGVAVSGLSRRQNDPAGYRAACRAGFLPVLAVVMPVLAFMAVEAHDVIRVLLGERWLGAVPILRILCIGYFVGSMGRLTTMLLLSQGDTKRQFRWALLYAPVLAVAVGIGVQWGPVGAAVGVAAATWVLSSPRLVFSLETSPISPRELLGIAARPALASIGAGAVLLAAGWLLPDGGAPVTRLGLAALVFGLAYALAWTVSPGNRRAAREALGLFRELWRRKKDRRAASGVIGSASEIAGAAVLD